MTVEGTFPFGAAVAVSAIAHGISSIVATLLATVAGMLCRAGDGVVNYQRPNSGATCRDP